MIKRCMHTSAPWDPFANNKGDSGREVAKKGKVKGNPKRSSSMTAAEVEVAAPGMKKRGAPRAAGMTTTMVTTTTATASTTRSSSCPSYQQPTSSSSSPQASPTCVDALIFEETCYLHSLKSGDTLPLVALKYNSTEGTIQDVNQLRSSDLDCLPPSTLLVVPLKGAEEMCCELNTRSDFLELYGSRLAVSFRQRRPRPVAKPADHHGPTFNDLLEVNNEAQDYELEYARNSIPAPRKTRDKRTSAIARTIKSIFTSATGNSNPSPRSNRARRYSD